MIKALGQILDLQFRRVQFTPDLMPGDILGTHILRETAGGGREMTFQSGPVFTNILLADEINRASPKTQSALSEAMQERSVTLLGNDPACCPIRFRPGQPEPDRVGGHVPAARGPVGPLPLQTVA